MVVGIPMTIVGSLQVTLKMKHLYPQKVLFAETFIDLTVKYVLFYTFLLIDPPTTPFPTAR